MHWFCTKQALLQYTLPINSLVKCGVLVDWQHCVKWSCDFAEDVVSKQPHCLFQNLLMMPLKGNYTEAMMQWCIHSTGFKLLLRHNDTPLSFSGGLFVCHVLKSSSLCKGQTCVGFVKNSLPFFNERKCACLFSLSKYPNVNSPYIFYIVV